MGLNTSTYVTATTDPVTGGITDLQAGGRSALADLGVSGFVTPYTGAVATNGSICDSTLFAFNSISAWSRSAHYARDTIRDAKLVFGNFYVNSGGSEVAGAGSLSMTASIEYPEGVFTQVKWSGSATGTMAAGDVIVSDASTVVIPRGSKFWVRLYFTSAAKSIHYVSIAGVADLNSGEAFNHATTTLSDPTMGGAMVDAGGAAIIIRPLAIVGTTNRASAIIFGDSRQSGSSEGTALNSFGFRGTIPKIVGPRMAYINCSRGGALASSFISASTRCRALIPYASHIFAEHGINDIVGGANIGTMTTRMASYWSLLTTTGKKLITVTMSPEGVTTTDAYATLANQTVSARNSVRTGVNAIIRKCYPPLDGFFEVADFVESARDSGLWKSPGYTTDGTHETWLANTEVQARNRIDDFL